MSRHRYSLRESVRQKAQYIDEAKKRFLRRGEMCSVIEFRLLEVCKNVLYLSLVENEVYLSENRAEATDNVST